MTIHSNLNTAIMLASLLLTAAVAAAVPFDGALDWGSKLHGVAERDADANPIGPRQVGPRQAGDPEGYGFHSGWFYSAWSQCRNSLTYRNLPNGSYTSNWRNCQNWVGGKGWNPGGAKVVEYNGTWSGANANSYLALYGWTKNPLIEYYIVDAYGTFNPGSNSARKGTVTSDGGTYDIHQSQRVNQPSIEGTKTFTQFWSIRRGRRVGGQITTGNHFAAWTQSGLKLGEHNYMILGTEGYQSSGSSAITVREVGVTGNPYPNEPDSRKDNN